MWPPWHSTPVTSGLVFRIVSMDCFAVAVE